MQIACQTILWGRQIANFEETVKAIAHEGFSGIEIAQRPDLLGGIHSANDLQSLLDDFDIELLGLAGGTLTERIDFATGVFQDIYLYVERWDRRDEAAIQLAIKCGFRIAIHPHVFKPVQTLRNAGALLIQHRDLRILPDTAHLKIVGDRPEDILTQINNESIAAIHLKDWRPEYGRSSHRYARGFVELGQGIVGIKDFVSLLHEKQYKGWVVFEQDSANVKPVECLRRNAKWLRDQNMPLIPNKKRNGMRYTLPPHHPLASTLFDADQRATFYAGLIKSSLNTTEDFFAEVAQKLTGLVGCRFASIWACSTAKDFLSLVAIHPDPPKNVAFHRCQNLVDSLSQDSVDGHKVTTFDLTIPAIAQRSSNSNFFLAAKLTSMLSIPVANASNTNHIRYIINLFDDKPFASGHNEEYYEIAQNIAIVADKVLDDACSFSAGTVDLIKTEPHNAYAYANRLRRRILETFDCEGVSIFLVNEHNDKLIYTGQEADINWSCDEAERYYKRGEGLTGGVWRSNKFLFTRLAVEEVGYIGKSSEVIISAGRTECIIAPIAKFDGEVLGIVRCVNKQENGHRFAATMFSDDDAALLEAMLQAAVPRIEILLKNRQLAEAIGRLPDQIEFPLKCIYESSSSLLTSNRLTPEVRILKTDVLPAVELIRSLLSNVTMVSDSCLNGLRPKTACVSLYSDIIVPAQRRCELLLRKNGFGFANFDIDPSMPEVCVDAKMLIQVFFTLFSNAIKYHRSESQLRIKVIVVRPAGRKGVHVIVGDQGRGVPSDIVRSIFNAGFRGEVGIHSGDGQGIGLYLCRQIAIAHACEISLRNAQNPTEFEVFFPPGIVF
jgi:sugar phosphate isomerase/epimerase/signal transduction histidine kinase